MQRLDSLGAGFSLASHDLDIRGAGNLLGTEQSGHIKEVGIELINKCSKRRSTPPRRHRKVVKKHRRAVGRRRSTSARLF